jgi:hypothetical protein
MDRVIVYDGQIPDVADILLTNMFVMTDGAFKNQALLGTSTVVAGLACAPTAPASLNVTVGVGSIFQLDPVDATAYGAQGANPNTNIVKQGLLQSPVTLPITPPVTAGQSQVFVVQATLNDTDTGSQVLSFYNSTNPDQPYAGPAGSGASSYTIRKCNCVIALKAGVAATTGSQVTPSADPGYVGLFAVTVANGAASITSANIAQLASAPFFPTLPSVPGNVQGGNWVYAGQDTGTANNYVITFVAGQPIPSAYVAGMGVKFKALNTNTAGSVINVNGLGNVTIKRANGTALAASDITSGQVVELVHDGTAFQMVNYLGTGTVSNTSTVVEIPYVADSGTVNALVGTYSPAITGAQQVAGLFLAIKLANTITGACTINVNGLGVKNVLTGDLQNPPNALFMAGEVLLLVYDGVQYQIVNSTSQIYRKPSSNLTIYVNGTTGSDTLYDGTSATVGSGTAGPLKTISKAILVAWGYAPSQYTITIQVAAGTYVESVQTPQSAGPTVIINGASAASVTVNGGNQVGIGVFGPNTMTVQNVTVQTNGGGNLSSGFAASGGASMTTSNTASNGCGGAVFNAGTGGTLKAGNHTFNGSSTYLYWAVGPGIIGLNGATHTFSTSISVTASVAVLFGGLVATQLTGPPVTYVNAGFVSGAKYDAEFNGTIDADQLGYSFYPGTSAGTLGTGGQYRP